MIHKIKTIKGVDGGTLMAVFLDGTVKCCDVKTLFEDCPALKVLEDPVLFQQVTVDVGGYGVSWNDELDLDAETIWESGVLVGQCKVPLTCEVADKLAKARAMVNMTQKQLAEKTGIHQGDISKIERGQANPSLQTLQRLAEGLGMKVDIEFKEV